MDPTSVLATQFRVIAMDQRNAGRSTGPITANDDWGTYAADHIALLDHLGIERVHIMGGCIGSSFCLRLCRDVPNRISAAVLQNPIGLENNAHVFEESFAGWRELMRAAHPAVSDDVMARFDGNLHAADFVFQRNARGRRPLHGAATRDARQRRAASHRDRRRDRALGTACGIADALERPGASRRNDCRRYRFPKPPHAAVMHPDAIVTDADVVTMDPYRPKAQAFAVRDGRFAALGTTKEMLALAGPHTQLHIMDGRTVVPGLIDAHAHMDREGLRRWYPSLAACASIADVQRVVAGCVTERADGEWIVTSPLGTPPYHLAPATTLAEGRLPDRADLDAAAPANPVWIRSVWGHWTDGPPYVHVLNSAALAACGIDANMASPSSTVTIERDASGALTGRIIETNLTPVAEFTLLRAAPRFTHEIRVAALANAMALSLAAGTTSVYEGHGISPDVYAAYKTLYDRDEQPVRLTMALSLPPWSSVGEASTALHDWGSIASGRGIGDDRLRVAGIYLEYGGHAENANLVAPSWPYTGWAGFQAHAIPPDEYRELCRTAARLRLRVNTTIGRELNDVLTIWDEVHREFPIDDLRWVLIHARYIDPQRDVPRIKRLGAVVTTQPSSYAHKPGDPNIDDNTQKAHRDYIDAGLTWALASDNKPYELVKTMWAAVTRTEAVHGRIVGPKQRISVEEALRALTSSGAYVCFNEQRLGTITPGKHADAIAFSDNPFKLNANRLRDLQVDFTMAGGRTVHDRLEN
jgi:predicted amidohydrolase YtcJ